MAGTIHPGTALGSVHLRVRDLARAVQFYTRGLGLVVLAEGPGSVLLGSGGRALLALEEAAGASRPGRTAGLYHLALLLPSRLQLARALDRLQRAHVPVSGFADHLVSEAIYLADPDGNGLELYIDRDRSQWPVMNGQVQMATDPLDAQRLLEEAHPVSAWTGIEPGTDIGHVHLQVSDLGGAEAFYCGLLGFQVTQRSYPGALFVSVGGYHHHVGLNTWASRGAPPPPAEAVGLEAFQVAIPEAAAFTRLKDRLAEVEQTIENPADKSFEILDPDGIQIEIMDTSVVE